MSVKAVQWKGWGLWREGFKEKVSFEFRVEKSRSDGQWQWWWWDRWAYTIRLRRVLMMLLVPGWPTMGLNRIRNKKKKSSQPRNYINLFCKKKRDATSLLTHCSFQTRGLQQKSQLYIPHSLNTVCHQSFPDKKLQSFDVLKQLGNALQTLVGTLLHPDLPTDFGSYPYYLHLPYYPFNHCIDSTAYHN